MKEVVTDFIYFEPLTSNFELLLALDLYLCFEKLI
jgi:hypothetical protein